ncbi:hypothetical protein DP23_4353 [Ralstonia pickettii]|nr:hypothetical protein DP23_4353 [Ralstonia pickettii]
MGLPQLHFQFLDALLWRERLALAALIFHRGFGLR